MTIDLKGDPKVRCPIFYSLFQIDRDTRQINRDTARFIMNFKLALLKGTVDVISWID